MKHPIVRLFLSVFLCLSVLMGCSKTPEELVSDPGSSSALSENTETDESTPVISASSEDPELSESPRTIRISEVMGDNDAFLLSPIGDFSDWVELYNYGNEPVDLTGWSLTTDTGKTRLLEGILAPLSYQVIFTAADESLGKLTFRKGVTVNLIAPDAETIDSLSVTCSDSDTSLAYFPEKDCCLPCDYPTPGSANVDAGYLLYQQSRSLPSPLAISEVSVYTERGADWIELRNTSSSYVHLSDYCLSDSFNDLSEYPLPPYTLPPGEVYVIALDQEGAFSLGFDKDELYLSRDGVLLDYVSLMNIPYGGSYGRLADSSVFYYFTVPSPGIHQSEEMEHYLMRTPEVTASLPAGSYEDTEKEEISLLSEGTIYYTTDGTRPTVNSKVYTDPIEITATTIVRCFSVEEDKLPSPEVSFGYFLNEGGSLPVLSLVVDNFNGFTYASDQADKTQEFRGSLSFYEGTEAVFSENCGTSVAGWMSTLLWKKSYNIHFRPKYGLSEMHAHIFENGIDEYSNLSIRAGQDYIDAVIRDEVCLELAMEMEDSHVFTHPGRYCSLYINGKYWGLYSLKENLSDETYGSRYGVSDDSVIRTWSDASYGTPYYNEVVSFVDTHDMTLPENYEYFCSVVDVDNFIDWIIIEGWAANVDTQSNVRFFRSEEGDTRWRYALYDLDWALYFPHICFYNLFTMGIYNNGYQMPRILNAVAKNETFQRALLERYSRVITTTLSDENVLRKIDDLEAEVQEELHRDRARWYLSYSSWEEALGRLKGYINGRAETSIRNLQKCLNVSDEMMAEYFDIYR